MVGFNSVTPRSSQGEWNNPAWQPYNQDGSRNWDPNATQLNSTSRTLNRVQSGIDPMGIRKLLGFKKKKAPPGPLWNEGTRGVDSLLTAFEQGDTGSQAIQRILGQFVGSREQYADFMETFGPTMGALEANRLERSDAFQYMQDMGNWDMGAYSGYGQQASAIGQGTTNAQRQAAQDMSSRGLGRSSGNTAMQALLAQQGASQQGAARAQTEQMAAQNRMQSATQMQDAYRLLAQMTMSQGLLPRISSPQGDNSGGYGGIAGGAMAGAQLGSAVGPWGTLIGGVAGAGAGYAASR